MPRMLDLYSGLGGASEAFVRAGWEVVRVENNPLLENVPHTILHDVRDHHVVFEDDYDFVWASPPCTEFSNAYGGPKGVAYRSGVDFAPDLTLLNRALEIIELIKPKYWAIENVAGASKIFSHTMKVNSPRQIIGPFFIWGIFPFVIVDYDWTHTKASQDVWSSDPLRANKKGKIPFEISRGFLNSITNQKQITEWIG